MERCCNRTLVNIGTTSYGKMLYACPVCGLVRIEPNFKPRKEATAPKTGNNADCTKQTTTDQVLKK